jgi:putative SOS response-associated peptidase YedK
MCGRYFQTRPADALSVLFEARDETDGAAEPGYNVAPTDPVPVVLVEPDPAGRPVRRLRMLRWGLVPPWARDLPAGLLTFNARSETAAVKPAFRPALRSRRCLLPADGFFEWTVGAGGRREPWAIEPVTGGGLALGGLYENRPGAGPDSCTILTTAAGPDTEAYHDRAPLLVPAGEWSRWLDPAVDAAHVADLLLAAPAGTLRARRVPPLVNDVRASGPQLLADAPPVPTQPALW